MKNNEWCKKIKLISRQQLEEYLQKSNSLASALLQKGASINQYRNKIYIGDLSQGCKHCGDGEWSCIFINGLCTSNCAFCPQDRSIKKERKVMAENFQFDSPEEYIDYLKQFSFRGVSFSGGEPFLVFNKMVNFIRLIKREFGDKIYTWVYTNGNLVNGKKLKILNDIGLDEIRFNIIPENYDLKKPSLSKKTIKKTAIEIPMLPTDKIHLLNILGPMADLGIDYLNLHQLYLTSNNYNRLPEFYEYSLCSGVISNFQSKIDAMEIIQYAVDKKLNIAINFCSSEYKSKSYRRALRKKISTPHCKPYESITETGFIKQVGVTCNSDQMWNIILQLKKEGFNSKMWKWQKKENSLLIHSDLFDYFKNKEVGMQITYFTEYEKRTGKRTKHTFKKSKWIKGKIYQTPVISNFQSISNKNVPEEIFRIIKDIEYIQPEFM